MHCVGNYYNAQQADNVIPSITESTPMLQTSSHTDSLHLSALLSGMYGMLIYLLALVILTAYVAGILDTTEHVTDKTFNVYAITLYVIAIGWVVGDLIYLKVNQLAPTDTEMSMASSLHVKGGIVTFGFMSILMSVIDIALTASEHDNQILYGIGNGTRIIFVIAEMIYLINFSNVSVTKWSGLRRFGLMHVMVTNFKDMTMNVIIDSGLSGIIPSTSNPINATNSSLQSTWDAIEPYLDVCRIQYCFIATAMVAIMWHNIGKETIHQQVKTTDLNNGHYSSWNTSVAVILGFGVIIGTVAAMIISSSDEKHEVIGYYWIRVILNLITLFTVIVLLIVSRRFYGVFQQSLIPYQLDELIIGLCLVFFTLQEMYSALSLIVALWCKHVSFAVVTTFDQILTGVRVVIQSILIVQSLRLKVTVPTAQWYRSMLLFLSMSNLAWWIITLTELKNDQHIYETQKDLYGDQTYGVIHGITGPFVVFYYYQSSVCFFEMWMTNNRQLINIKIASD